MTLMQALGKERQGVSKFKGKPIYRTHSRATRSIQRNHALKTPKQASNDTQTKNNKAWKERQSFKAGPSSPG